MRAPRKSLVIDCGGAAAIEFALVGILVALCLPAIIDLTTIINSSMQMASGMRAGQRYALKYPDDAPGITQAIAGASGLPADAITVDTSRFCECNTLPSACSTSCGGGFQLAQFITITASYDMSGQYNYPNPLYPEALSNQITVRIQ